MDLLLLFFLFFFSSTSSSSLLLLIVVAVVIVMLIDFDICVSNSAFKCSLCGWGDLHEIGNCYIQRSIDCAGVGDFGAKYNKRNTLFARVHECD